MNILVTGGGGFIGVTLCKTLLEQGHHVIAIDNHITSDPPNVQPLLPHPNFKFIKHDITKPLSIVNGQLSTVDEVFHLACPTGVPNTITLAEEMLRTCSIGTKNVLDLAKEHKAKLLFTSSSEIYGDPQIFPQDETYTGNVDPTGIRSPYEEGKRFSESLTTMYFRTYGLDTKIVRIFNTYGPGMSRHDTRVIPTFMRQLQNNEPLTIYGDGSQKRTFCYVDDLVDGLLTVMAKGERGEVYNLGNDEEITIKDLANLMLDTLRHCEERSNPLQYEIATRRLRRLARNDAIHFIPNPIQDHSRRLPSLEKIKTLGWEPKVGLEEGLKNCCHSERILSLSKE